MQPAYAANFLEFSRTRPIRFDVATPSRGETLAPAEIERPRGEIRARRSTRRFRTSRIAAPKKARKLLVIESLEGMSHNTIPQTNVMIQRMGEKTGAWTTVFSNDLEQPSLSKGQGVRRDLPEQHRRRVPAGSGAARGPGALRQRGRRHRRYSWHTMGVAQLGRVCRDDRRAERSAPHRKRRHEGVRQGQSDRAAVQLRGLPFREEYYRFEMRATGGCAGTKCACCSLSTSTRRCRRRPTNRGPDTGARTRSTRGVDPRVRQGACLLQLDGPHDRNIHEPEIVGHFLAGMQYILGDLDANATPNPLGK